MKSDRLYYDEHGHVPAIVQDVETGAVLMLAYMNRESLDKTLETGETHFWSRSRRELWHKGKTSGNVQRVKAVRYDCDADALLVLVEQKGVACHTGKFSCFHHTLDFTPGGTAGKSDDKGAGSPAAAQVLTGEVLGALGQLIHRRNLDRPEGSYTAGLFNGGIDKILKKVGEEAGEVIIAAKNHAPSEITWEVADLLFHLLVMMEQEGVRLRDVAAVLQERGNSPKSNSGT